MFSRTHLLLFPYFLYPGQTIMMTASIFMTVAIAMERYVAVHYPLDYNQVTFNYWLDYTFAHSIVDFGK